MRRAVRDKMVIVRLAGKALLFAALALFTGATLLALVPVRATAVEYATESERGTQVSCGSFPTRTEWSGDAGCDEARTRRITQLMGLGVASVALALVGVGLYVGDRRQDLTASTIERFPPPIA